MNNLFFVIALLALTPVLNAAEQLQIVKANRSDYKIVIPDSPRDRHDDLTARHVRESAEILRTSLQRATGANLPILSESDAKNGVKAIYLGDSAFARRNGIDVKKLQNWRYIRRAVGDNLIIAGLDERGPKGKERTYYSFGTMRGVTALLQEFAGVRFLLPGPHGTYVPRRADISVPRAEYISTPPLEFNIGVHPTNIYSVANNLFPAPHFNSHGGHSYYDAVPLASYASTHPEYFAMSDGKRNTSANHLCISNPEVQELLYRELLTELDRGFEMTELGQTDGYMPCRCQPCERLFGVSDPGEKLWILHRSFAERLLRDRPGKRLVILSYGPTGNTPATFDSFPANVMIELCSYSPEMLEKWKKIKVPGGFMAYIYNWGDYQLQGFTAKFGPASCQDQIELFRRHNIRGIYRCGFGELFGMEGPLHYAWGQGFSRQSPHAVNELLDEFYSCAYGAARAPMKKFFTTLYRRLDYFDNAQKSPVAITAPQVALAMIYTPDVLLAMSNNLKRAENVAGLSPDERARIMLVRRHFDYTENLARIIILYNALRIAPEPGVFAPLARELTRREKMIAPFLQRRYEAMCIDGWPDSHMLAQAGYIRANGRLRAAIAAPLAWDVGKLTANGIIPGQLTSKEMSVVRATAPVAMDGNFEAGAWRAAKWQKMTPANPANRTPAAFKLLYDECNFYVAFDAVLPAVQAAKYTPLGRDGAVWEQECMELLLDVNGTREQYFHLIFNPVANSYYDSARGLITDVLHPLYNKPDVSWNGAWEYRNFVNLAENRWRSVVKIPFASLGVTETPGSGSRWTANFGREHIPAGKKDPELLLWSPSMETSSFHDPDSYGELIFQ